MSHIVVDVPGRPDQDWPSPCDESTSEFTAEEPVGDEWTVELDFVRCLYRTVRTPPHTTLICISMDSKAIFFRSTIARSHLKTFPFSAIDRPFQVVRRPSRLPYYGVFN